MNIPRLSTRDRRALRLGALILGPALLWALVAAPYLRAVKDTGERIDAERQLLQREIELLASADRLPEILDTGADRLRQAAERLFGGGNPAIASAAVAEYLQTRARASRVLLTGLDPAPTEEPVEGVLVLPLRVQGETDLEGLLTFIHSLESGPKLVRLEDLRVQGLRTGATLGADDVEVLTFGLSASGYMLAQVAGSEAVDAGGER